MLRHLRDSRLRWIWIALALTGLLLLFLGQQTRMLRELAAAERARLATLLGATAERLAAELAASAADLALDQSVLRAEPERVHALVSPLIEAYLGPDAAQRFAVRIRELASGASLYDSEQPTDPRAAALSREPEARVPLFWGRPHWSARFEDEDGQRSALEAPLLLSLADRAGSSSVVDRAAYVLELRSLGRSLDAFVAGMQVRNLLLGCGTTLALVASLVLLWLGAQRARRSAERELAFVAGVSHELRTPLAVLRTAASNLTHGVVQEPERVREYGALVEREVLRLTEMVERALALGSADAAPARREDCDLAELLGEAVRRTRALPGARELAVELDPPPGGARARLERDAVLMAVQNLLENAAKHGATEPPVRLRARRERGSVRIEVADRGPGLARGEELRVFEPFQRGERARATRSAGAGLGLALVRRVARRHGGEASVRRTDGWTVFSLTLAVSEEAGA